MQQSHTHNGDQAVQIAQNAQAGFQLIRNTSNQQRRSILQNIQNLLSDSEQQQRILDANAKDLQVAKENSLPAALQERLMLNSKRIKDIVASIEVIIESPDLINQTIFEKKLNNGIRLMQKKTPLGVLFVIYESRPNVTVDVAVMCIKTANAVILRGGKEARHSNLALFEIIKNATAMTQLGDAQQHIVQYVYNSDRKFMQKLLLQSSYIDLVIPRGGEGLIQFVSEHSRIPVIKHDKGVCNLYIDQSADYSMALAIAINAKLQRPSVCNAIENLIIHCKFPNKQKLLTELQATGVKILGDQKVVSLAIPNIVSIESGQEDTVYGTEFLSEKLSVKVVDSLDEAIHFIHKYGSGHSEAIISSDTQAIEEFQRCVDSAAIFVNCSTRFHDGGQMGFGAEIGISTTRLHCRGPMGLSDLMTTSYFLIGDGQIRAD